jgi:hypothetical protein
MFPPGWAHFLPAKLHFRQTLAAQHAGLLAGSFTAIPAEPPPNLRRERLRIHFWTPNPWPSTAIHVERVLPQLRSQAAALDLPWQITSGGLPDAPVDWLLCLKAVPPAGRCPPHRTVLLLPDDADRFWSRLKHFGHVVSVSSPAFASLLGIVHPHAWFIEETEAPDVIETGQRALDRAPSSQRIPTLLWHGTRESLDGLYVLKDALTAFGNETGAELTILTNLPQRTERWNLLRVRYAGWSPQALNEMSARARLGIVPARPTLSDSYLKSAGRMRGLFARGCPAIGDARSPDVVAFSEACGIPAAHTFDQWLATMRQLWQDPASLDQAARNGLALVREHYNTARTATQWLWFLAGGAEGRTRTECDAADNRQTRDLSPPMSHLEIPS